MQIKVTLVEPCGFLGIGEGTDADSGARVSFVGEFRMLAEIAEALDAGEEVVAEVPEWAITWREAA